METLVVLNNSSFDIPVAGIIAQYHESDILDGNSFLWHMWFECLTASSA